MDALDGSDIRLGRGMHELADKGNGSSVVHVFSRSFESFWLVSDPLSALMLGYSPLLGVRMLKEIDLSIDYHLGKPNAHALWCVTQ